jgi:acyl carrier protein
VTDGEGRSSGTLDAVRGLIAEVAGTDPGRLSLDTRLDDLLLDSLQRLELLVLIEERHGVRLPDRYLESPTLGEVVQGMIAPERELPGAA